MSWIGIVGWVMLIFRLWLVEVKLKDKLPVGRRYVSRTANYMYWFSLIYEFKCLGANLVIFYGTPVFIAIFFKWDLFFYRYYKKRTDWHDETFWIFTERLTMHPPMIGIGIYYYTQGFFRFNLQAIQYHNVTSVTDWYFISSLIFSVVGTLGFYLLWDPRWADKKGWPIGVYVLIFASISVFTHLIYFVIEAPNAFGFVV